MQQILIIEDDRALNQGLCKALKTDNSSIQVCSGLYASATDRQIVSCENLKDAKEQLLCEKEKDNEHVYRKEPYVFDFDRMKFMVDGKEIELSKTEQKLLRILVENAGMNMRRELLLDRVWSDGAEYVDENALSVSVKRLRDKLGAEHAIRTVYGIGYRWE